MRQRLLGLQPWLSSEEQQPLARPGPTAGGSRLPGTPVPGDLMPFSGLCGHVRTLPAPPLPRLSLTRVRMHTQPAHSPHQEAVTTCHTHGTSPPAAKPTGTGPQAGTCPPASHSAAPTFSHILRAPQQGLLDGGQDQILKLRVGHEAEQGGTVVLQRQRVRPPASREE